MNNPLSWLSSWIIAIVIMIWQAPGKIWALWRPRAKE
jgi:hypothetical protein